MGTPKIPYFFLSPAILVLCLIVTTVAYAGEGGGRQQAWVEPGVDRPGSDFKLLWLRGGPGARQGGGPGGLLPESPVQILHLCQGGSGGAAGRLLVEGRRSPACRGSMLHLRGEDGRGCFPHYGGARPPGG